ncbi:MAG: 3-oxoacyl-ACP synthase, partial [Treponema sp.]|nr:3-oxoacyl-ACP synthase [Treponema sp.]
MNVYLSSPAVFCCCAESAGGLWNSVISGNRSGIKKVTALNGKEFYAARIDDSLLKEPASARYDMRIIRIEEKCVKQISDLIEKARKQFGSDRIGVCVGSCDNGTEFSVAGHREFFKNGEFSPAYALEMQGADYVATYISEAFGLTGPSMTFSTACSSSAGALIKACELVQAGVCDAVIAGGVDIASDTTLIGFDALEAVSPEMTNPFSKNRHGITLGDAAAFFLV